MAITTNSAYASGTVSSVSGTTFTASGSTFASGDVGRCIYMLNGDAEGQTRKIVGYISGTVVTLDHAWDDSPIDGITEDEPSNGDTFFVSYFFDELDDGSNLIKHDQFCYELTSTWNASNTFVYDTNITFICNGANLNFSTSACLRLGDKTSDSFSSNGCNIFDTNSATFGWDSGDLGGDFQMYGGTFTGVNSSSFWRFQANGMVRFCDVTQFGRHGMRLTGAKSAIVNYKVVGNDATFSPFTVAGTFGQIRNISAYNCDACLYWQSGTPGGAATLKNVRAENLDEGYFQYRPLSDTKLTLEGVEVSEIEDAPKFGDYISGGPSAFEVDVKNNIAINAFNSSGTALTGHRIYIENEAGTEQENSTGDLEATAYLIRYFDMASGDSTGGVDWGTDGTSYTPMLVKIRKYGYQAFNTSWDGRSSLTTLNIFMVDDNVVVANEAIAGAYTGIAVNGSSETITISSDHTLQEIYDYIQWWSTQSANMQYVVPMTSADGNTFILAQNWDLICDGGDITSGTGKSLNFSGTGILQLNGNTANNVNVSSGDVHLESATDLTGMTIANDLRIDTGVNSTLNFTGINVGGNVWNDSASNTLTINAVTSNITAGDAGTGNGETNIVNAVIVTITCVDISGTPIENARVYLKTTADGVIYNDLTDVNGQISLSYNYTGDEALVESKARKGSSLPYFKSAPISGTITSNGLSATITMISDE
jgi:hypothetical protein